MAVLESISNAGKTTFGFAKGIVLAPFNFAKWAVSAPFNIARGIGDIAGAGLESAANSFNPAAIVGAGLGVGTAIAKGERDVGSLITYGLGGGFVTVAGTSVVAGVVGSGVEAFSIAKNGLDQGTEFVSQNVEKITPPVETPVASAPEEKSQSPAA